MSVSDKLTHGFTWDGGGWAQGPHSYILMTGEGEGGPSDFLGSEILAKSDFFGVYETCRDFFGPPKKTKGFFWVAKQGLRDFLGMPKKVVIFLGRQILKL